MIYPLHTTSIQLQYQTITLLVPNDESVKAAYLFQQQQNKETPFPYWAKLWPSSIAMADFLFEHNHFINNKSVLELAAGLALPSFVAAGFAKTVCCSDYLTEAVAIMQSNINHHGFKNVHSKIIDWNDIPTGTKPDVLLLSDVNYAPAAFEKLYEVIRRFLLQNTIIILATPQRLMAKSFIEKILPFCTHQEERNAGTKSIVIPVSVMVLQKPD